MRRFPEIVSYEEALAFLYGRINYERVAAMPYGSAEFKLPRMRELLDRLGNPQRAVAAVHVAGTKGKGSTAAMIAAILAEAGYRTGLYTSPHLDRLEERMTIDSKACREAELVDLVESVRETVQTMDRRADRRSSGSAGPTFFEVVTAMAMLHFARCGVDVAVLEVGLGGRLDSTNVCHPLVSVITSISYDHTQQLGDSLADIAAEKAGIIKPGVPVVSGVVQHQPRRVIERVALGQGSRLFTLGKDFDFSYTAGSLRRDDAESPTHGGRIAFRQRPHDNLTDGNLQHVGSFRLGLLGRHQAANAAVALAAVARLREADWPIPASALATGLSRARCPARIEVVARRPTVVVDAAHNVASVRALVETLAECFVPSERTLVFATSNDKDAVGMLRLLTPRFQKIIFTRYVDNPRSADPWRLAELARTLEPLAGNGRVMATQISVCAVPPTAWREASEGVERERLVCVAGSFFLAAEIRRLIRADCVRSEPQRLSQVL